MQWTEFVLLDIVGSMLETIVHYIYHGAITNDEQNADAIVDRDDSVVKIWDDCF